MGDLRNAGFAPEACGVQGLYFYGEIKGKLLFVTGCGEMGGELWAFDPATKRFTRQRISLQQGTGATDPSPDKRYQLVLTHPFAAEYRAYVLKDFFLDTETEVGHLPVQWSYVHTRSEFDGGPLGRVRWEDGVAYLSVYDASISIADFAVARPMLFEKAVTVDGSASSDVRPVSYLIRDGKLVRGIHGQVLSVDVRKAGLDLPECGDGDLLVYAEIADKVFFTESCAVAQMGSQLWMYDGTTLRFTRRKLVPDAFEVAHSPDGRYRLALAEPREGNEARQLIVRDLLRDAETVVAPLPEQRSYSASVSEFVGAPFGKGRWEEGRFVVAVYDSSTALPFAAEEGVSRPVLFEKAVPLP